MLTAQVTVHQGYDADPVYSWEIYCEGREKPTAFGYDDFDAEPAARASLNEFVRLMSTHGVVVKDGVGDSA